MGSEMCIRDRPPLENCYVCSEHFSAESFEVNLREQITGTKCKRRLKEDAIPSEFSFRPPAKRPRLSSENRLRRRSHEEKSVEKEGFKRCIESLEDDRVQIDRIATDRHVSISSFMNKERPQINHQYDVWHLSKRVVKN